jgi:hypothetical protein
VHTGRGRQAEREKGDFISHLSFFRKKGSRLKIGYDFVNRIQMTQVKASWRDLVDRVIKILVS